MLKLYIFSKELNPFSPFKYYYPSEIDSSTNPTMEVYTKVPSEFTIKKRQCFFQVMVLRKFNIISTMLLNYEILILKINKLS